MSNALENEILEKFHQLDAAAQQRVQAAITSEIEQAESFDYDTWFHEVEAIREAIRAEHGGQQPIIDVVDMLRDIRYSDISN